ncbi:hypothetical protein DL93DRAFT_2050299 [Clavulina sp. PMI_390]|nr:hypothetical protein DL93DRAFT_2050299 [Clavulina sp. PMI_390]
MELLDDIHAHHILKHDLSHDMAYQQAPIDYVALQEWHINQVHDLLRTSFWPGIDVSTALEYHPEKYTVVAMYRRVVVGVALISPPPDEAYVTYITVKEGWKNAGIAKTMLYLLIRSSPDRDIMLHVSADNPAMILYNKFGFKAEEFVVGFYEDYIDPKSKACRNALRLRLRQQ